MNKKKLSEKSLRQSKFKEISMGSDSIDELFDSSKRIGYETEDERDYREQKEDYNKTIMKLIKKLNFTDRQREIFNLMYVKNLTLTETAKKLNIKIESVNTTRKLFIKKIKNKIHYDFNYNEEKT
jgi:RNA polymerase sigma factor (sigma-70 family)